MTVAETTSAVFDVLVVEDSPSDAFLCCEALRETGVRIETHVVGTASDAIKYLDHAEPFTEATTPDLVLLDFNLPGMNGLEFLEVVKNDPVKRLLPVIVLTTSNAESDVKAAYEKHANSYFVKPVRFGEFKEMMASVVDYWFLHGVVPRVILPHENRP